MMTDVPWGVLLSGEFSLFVAPVLSGIPVSFAKGGLVPRIAHPWSSSQIVVT